ncbi:hypothetical protein HDU78_010771 [Chytriomyces hyalinus]|nr:hypothetical protein HDU78_010771 [Chytriomyces hyalinus]
MNFRSEDDALLQLSRIANGSKDIISIANAVCKRASLPSSTGIALGPANVGVMLGALASGAFGSNGLASSGSVRSGVVSMPQLHAVCLAVAAVASSAGAWGIDCGPVVECTTRIVRECYSMNGPSSSNQSHLFNLLPAFWKDLVVIALAVDVPARNSLLFLLMETAASHLDSLSRQSREFFTFAKLYLVHINSIVASTTSLDTIDIATFLLSISTNVFQAGLQSQQDFKIFNYGIQCVMYTHLEKQTSELENDCNAVPRKRAFLRHVLTHPYDPNAPNDNPRFARLNHQKESFSDAYLSAVAYISCLVLTVCSNLTTDLFTSENHPHNPAQSNMLYMLLSVLNLAPLHVKLYPTTAPAVSNVQTRRNQSDASPTLFAHAAVSLILFAKESGMENTEWLLFETALFDGICGGFVDEKSDTGALLCMEVLWCLVDELPVTITCRWIPALYNLLEQNQRDPVLTASVAGFLKKLLERGQAEPTLHNLKRMDTAQTWIWSVDISEPVVNNSEARSSVEAVLKLWNEFLCLLDADEEADHVALHLQAFATPISALAYAVPYCHRNELENACCEPVVFLVEGMEAAFEAVVVGPETYVHMYRTVRALLSLVETMRFAFSKDQVVRLVTVLESWISTAKTAAMEHESSRAPSGLLLFPQKQSEKLLVLLQPMTL